MPFSFKMPVSVSDKNKKQCRWKSGHPVKVLIVSTALVLVGAITIRRAFAARLSSFCQKLIQTVRILFVFLELDWTATRTRSITAVGSTQLLVRNEFACFHMFLQAISLDALLDTQLLGELDAPLRDLRRLARARFTHQHDALVLLQQGKELVAIFPYG